MSDEVMVTLCYIGDGYLAAAEEGMVEEGFFMMHEADEPDLLCAELPPGLAHDVCLQGTSGQVFSDGYDAANAVAVHLKNSGVDIS